MEHREGITCRSKCGLSLVVLWAAVGPVEGIRKGGYDMVLKEDENKRRSRRAWMKPVCIRVFWVEIISTWWERCDVE